MREEAVFVPSIISVTGVPNNITKEALREEIRERCGSCGGDDTVAAFSFEPCISAGLGCVYGYTLVAFSRRCEGRAGCGQ